MWCCSIISTGSVLQSLPSPLYVNEPAGSATWAWCLPRSEVDPHRVSQPRAPGSFYSVPRRWALWVLPVWILPLVSQTRTAHMALIYCPPVIQMIRYLNLYHYHQKMPWRWALGVMVYHLRRSTEPWNKYVFLSLLSHADIRYLLLGVYFAFPHLIFRVNCTFRFAHFL